MNVARVSLEWRGRADPLHLNAEGNRLVAVRARHLAVLAQDSRELALLHLGEPLRRRLAARAIETKIERTVEPGETVNERLGGQRPF